MKENNYTINNENNLKENLKLKISNQFNLINKWKFDKIIIQNKTNIIKKIEIYNYFNRNNIKKLIAFLNTKQFKYFENSSDFPRLFNILLSKNNKHITWKWKILDNNYLPKYYYFVDFIKVLNHRWRPILLKIYRNKSQNKNFAKIELTYIPYKKNYNLYFLDWLNWLKWINEIIKKLNKRFNFIWYLEDYSKQIKLDTFLNKVIENKTKSNKSYKNKILEILSA